MHKKLIPQFTKDISGRVVSGIFAVHGHVDEGYDRSFPGAFANTAINGRDRARFLWMHRGDEPPVAVIKSVQEVARPDLPERVLVYAPDATGGAEVVREYLDTPRGSEVLAGLKAGAIEEMSYGYDIGRHDFTTDGDRQIRNLYELKLYDISDVNWGLQPATVAVKSGLLAGLPLGEHSESVLAAVEELTERYADLKALRTKEGRVLSDANRKRIASLLEALTAVQKDLGDLLTATEPAPKGLADLHTLRALSRELRAHALELGVLQ